MHGDACNRGITIRKLLKQCRLTNSVTPQQKYHFYSLIYPHLLRRETKRKVDETENILCL